MTKVAAIYARVSSDRQKENHTIASQLAALTDYAEAHGYQVPSGAFRMKGTVAPRYCGPGWKRYAT